jgi:hypothetical protein
MEVQVPAGVKGGQSIQVNTPQGLMDVVVPEGLVEGQTFQINVPAPAAVVAQPAVVVAQPTVVAAQPAAAVAVVAQPVGVQPVAVQAMQPMMVQAVGMVQQPQGKPSSQGFHYGTTAAVVTCIFCGKEGTTRIDTDCCGMASWGGCAAICAFGLFCPCAWLGCQFLPFCIPSLQNKVHRCEHCSQQVGCKKAM